MYTPKISARGLPMTIAGRLSAAMTAGMVKKCKRLKFLPFRYSRRSTGKKKTACSLKEKARLNAMNANGYFSRMRK